MELKSNTELYTWRMLLPAEIFGKLPSVTRRVELDWNWHCTLTLPRATMVLPSNTLVHGTMPWENARARAASKLTGRKNVNARNWALLDKAEVMSCATHVLAPVARLKVPQHSKHVVMPGLGENVAVGHTLQLSMATADVRTLNLPAVQLVGTMVALAGQYVPLGQA